MIPRGVKWVGALAAVWSFLLWIPIALMFVLGATMPDPGTIVSMKVPVWAAIVVVLAEPLFLTLIWAAWYSRLGLILLTLYLTVIAVAASALALFLVFQHGLAAGYVLGPPLCWIAPAAIYALLIRQYTSSTPEG